MPTFWASLCEPSGATVYSRHRGSEETRGQAGSQPAQSLTAAGGGVEVWSGALPTAQPTDATTGDTAGTRRDGVASKVDVFEVVRAVSRR